MDEYLESKRIEATQIESEIKRYFSKLHISDLTPVTPDEYYEGLKDHSRPKGYKNPKKRWADKNAGITFGLRANSFFDADAKKELLAKEEQSAAIHAENVKEEKEAYNRYVDRFYKSQDNQHQKIDLLHDEMRNGNVEEICAYFNFVLMQDRYSVDYLNDYSIQVENIRYDEKKGQLCFAYRIPETEEILTFKSFVYDQDSDQIIPEPIDESHQYVQRMSILNRLLIRAVEMIYYSDTYHLINDVQITGFLLYYDDSYGTERRKDVIRFNLQKQDFWDTNFDRVNVKSLFDDRIKPKTAAGLYKKSSKEIKGI